MNFRKQLETYILLKSRMKSKNFQPKNIFLFFFCDIRFVRARVPKMLCAVTFIDISCCDLLQVTSKYQLGTKATFYDTYVTFSAVCVHRNLQEHFLYQLQ